MDEPLTPEQQRAKIIAELMGMPGPKPLKPIPPELKAEFLADVETEEEWLRQFEELLKNGGVPIEPVLVELDQMAEERAVSLDDVYYKLTYADRVTDSLLRIARRAYAIGRIVEVRDAARLVDNWFAPTQSPSANHSEIISTWVKQNTSDSRVRLSFGTTSISSGDTSSYLPRFASPVGPVSSPHLLQFLNPTCLRIESFHMRLSRLIVLVPVAFIPLVVAAPETPKSDYNPKIAKASDEGEKAIPRFKIDKALKVEVWAAEPMLANPVASHSTRRAVCYVAETFRHSHGRDRHRGHMNWLDDDLACRTVADRVAMYKKYLGTKFHSDYEKRARPRPPASRTATATARPTRRPSSPTASTAPRTASAPACWPARGTSTTPASPTCGCSGTRRATARPT